MGQENKYFKVGGLRLLQTQTYPERKTAALHLPAHPGPFPAIGKGGGGKGQMRCGYLGSDSVRSTDLFFLIIEGKTNPYPAQPATGVLGQSPKRVLVPFTRVKGTPRRRAVLIKSIIRLSPPKVITGYVTTAPPGRRAGCHPPVTAPRRQAPANFFIPPKSSWQLSPCTKV